MELVAKQNWAVSNISSGLEDIHRSEINIAICERELSYLNEELLQLVESDFVLRSRGDVKSIENDISKAPVLAASPLIQADIIQLLQLFAGIIPCESYRLYFASVNSDMCKRFHTDINDLRMLCTYRGQGTLWVKEDLLEDSSLHSIDTDCIDADDPRIRQANAGDILILKGAIYPKEGTKPILHRSPNIEERGDRRLLLRLDTKEFANF
ncbi:MAG: DUF1826 domain-containing protein [Bacteroidota bacterium]